MRSVDVLLARTGSRMPSSVGLVVDAGAVSRGALVRALMDLMPGRLPSDLLDLAGRRPLVFTVPGREVAAFVAELEALGLTVVDWDWSEG